MSARNRSARQACLLLAILVTFSFVESTFLNPLSATSLAVFTRTPTDDTYIDPWNPNSIFGLSNTVNASTSKSGLNTTIFLKFDLSGLPNSTQVSVVNVTLTLSLISSPLQKGDMLAVYGESNNSWTENTLKLTNAPLRNISLIPNNPKFVNSSFTSWNITSLVEPQLGINTVTTLVVHHYGPAPLSNTMLSFSSKEGNSPPTLTVTYRKNPSSITTLLVSSNQTIYGSPVIINATLSPPLKTGTIAIQFSIDGRIWSNIKTSSPGPNGRITALWFPPVATTYFIRTTWSGDPFTQDSTSALSSLTVDKQATTTSLILGASTIGFGNQTLVIASVTPQLSTGVTLSGGVMFIEYSSDSGANWAQLFSGAPTNSIAFQSFVPSLTGNYLFRARWLGDANYDASSSTVLQLTVVPAQTTLSFSVSPVAISVGSTAIISGFLRATGGGPISGARVVLQIGTTPTSSSGTTAFTNVTTLSTGVDGSFAYPWVTQTNGTYTLRANFDGTSVYSASVSRLQEVSVGYELFPTLSEVGLISGFIGFFIGLGVSLLVRFRRQVTVKRRQRYGGVRTKGEQSSRS